MSILCEKAGILTTVQDLGRNGFRRLGINPGGVMDTAAARVLNILVGNLENAALLELHFPAGRYRFLDDSIVAIGGGDFAGVLDDNALTRWQLSYARAGSVLEFREKRFGNRVYLAVKGGVEVGAWLGSRSTNLAASAGGFFGRKIVKGDLIPARASIPERPFLRPTVSRTLIPVYSGMPTVRVIKGAEFDELSASSIEGFTEGRFAITNESNRMGYRLSGEPLFLRKPLEMVSSAVAFGTIQLLPDGQMIVLMADHQTSGGYPRIAGVITRDLPLLAQCGPGDKLAFELISVDEAERLRAEFEREVRWLKLGVRLREV